MPATLEEILAVCNDCRKARKTKLTAAGHARVPSGWHKRADVIYCPDCWKKRYLLRAVSVPVASPVNCSWEELRTDLKQGWRETTRASNWIMTELYARDVRRGESGKMPALVRLYLYPELRREFPTLPPQTIASLEQSLTKKYRAARYAVIWTRSASLPSYRYPTPLPIHNQSWSIRLEDDKPILRMRLGESSRELRLKTGSQFHRQYRAIRLLARGEAIAGEAAIYQSGKSLMVKLVAWLPREESSPSSKPSTLRLRTTEHSLLVAVNLRDEALWTYNADHLRRWSAEHRKQLQRWSEDRKYEQRPVANFAQRLEAAAAKYRNRMNSATHEIAAQLAAYAARRHFTAVSYDDTEQGYLEGFPWFRLRALIQEKLEARGLQFEALAASGEAKPKDAEPLAE
jgi:hypothetical protein